MLNKKSYRHIGSEYLFTFFIFITLIIISLSISPLLCSIFIPSLLIIASEYISNELRKFLSVIGFISVSIVQASWVVSLVADIDVYFTNYQSLLNNDFQALFEFGGGIEIILPLYFFILGAIFGDITPVQMVLSVDIPVVIVLSIFLNFAVKKISPEARAMVIGSCIIVFFLSSWASLLLRQYFSLMFFLLAIMYRSKTFGLISIFTHFSSLLYFLALKTFLYSKKLFRILILIFSLAAFFIHEIASLVINLISNPILNPKFIYYLDDSKISSTGNQGAFNVLLAASLYLVTITILRVILKKTENPKAPYDYRLDIYLILAGVILTLNVPLLPGRVFLIPILLSPLFAYLAFPYNNRIVFKILYLFLFILFFTRNIMPGLINPIVDINSYWQAFDWYGVTPFYYLY